MNFKAKLIAVTKPVEDMQDVMSEASELIAYCARVSNPSNQTNMATSKKLIDYLIRHKHWSPLEMVNCVVEVECPRDIARQLLRHRSFSYQEFCISKDSLVKTDKGNISIENLYRMQKNKEELPLVKVYDEEDRIFKFVKIKEVFDTGEKPVYELRLKSGKRIVSTMEHKFLTKEGFKELKDIEVGCLVGTNGVPCYQNYDWLEAAKKSSIENGTGLSGIAEKARVTTHTIRKWLRVHGLQFSRKEVGSYTPIWNKGLPTEQQPKYGKITSEQTRKKQHESSVKGADSLLWKGGVERGFRQKIFDWQYKYKNAIMTKYNNTCVKCGTKEELELDHIFPVKTHPEKAFDIENIQVLCRACHRSKSVKEYSESPNFSKAVSITEAGIIQTYDLEVDHVSHNYVANHIVTHNSQRYSDVNMLGNSFILREARYQDEKNRQNSIAVDDVELQTWWEDKQKEIIRLVSETYNEAIDKGIAKECARVILPEGNTMSRLYVNGTIRSWIHYLQVRTEEGVTQLEHVILARLIAEQINKVFVIYD